MNAFLNILFSSLLAASILFMPKQHSSMESQKEENFASCCIYKDIVDRCCEKYSHENKKCEGDCLADCCCSEVELKSEKYLNFMVVIFKYPTKSLDIYESKYKYSFHYTIYKPPITFIS